MVRTKAAVVTASVIMALGGAMLAGAPAASAAAPAAAAVPAYCGSTCDGKNPQTYAWAYEGPSQTARFCSQDAITAKSSDGLELRYSPDCRTAWARLQNPDALVGAGTLWHIEVQSFNTNGTKRKSYSSGSTWTSMVNDKGLTARACIYTRPGAESDPTLWFCTGKY